MLPVANQLKFATSLSIKITERVTNNVRCSQYTAVGKKVRVFFCRNEDSLKVDY